MTSCSPIARPPFHVPLHCTHYREMQLLQIAERIVSEADATGSGAVSFREFTDATKELDVEGRMSFISFS